MIPAGVLSSEIRRGERLARDTVAGALIATRAQQERLNICTFIESDEILERADAIDDAVSRGRDPGPLAGVPIAIKDIFDHVGRITTCGSSFYRHEPEVNATVVDRLEQAGAVIVSRTGLHEFAFGFSSENHWFGPVKNPLDERLSPGGSSGGSAAAVAAGQVPIAIGTDTGGSVRVPATLVGAFGLKVTHGRVPLSGVFPLAASLDTVGPIAGTVSDLVLGYTAIAGFSNSDPWSVPHPVVAGSGARPDLRGIRIGVPVEWVDRAPVVEEVASTFATAMGRLAGLGAEIIEIRDERLTPEGRMSEQFVETAAVHRKWRAEGKPYGPDIDQRLEAVEAFTADDLVLAMEWRAIIRQRTALAFGQVDFIATPATGATQKTIGVDMITTPEGDIHYREPLRCFSALVNIMGCPALVGPLPSPMVPPPGLQLIAPWWQEHRLLEVAATLEGVGVFQRPW